jgi:hypothetical protein
VCSTLITSVTSPLRLYRNHCFCHFDSRLSFRPKGEISMFYDMNKLRFLTCVRNDNFALHTFGMTAFPVATQPLSQMEVRGRKRQRLFFTSLRPGQQNCPYLQSADFRLHQEARIVRQADKHYVSLDQWLLYVLHSGW